MKRKKEKIILIAICTIIIVVISILIVNNMEEKEYWVMGAYPVQVNEEVKELGYKVIGTYKLWNPNPRPITLDDAKFIISKLPEWLSEYYPGEIVDIPFQQMNNQNFITKLHYVFTMFHQGETTEADFYLLKLKNNKKIINIYIGKGTDANPRTPPLTQMLIYPFYNEEWHSNINCVIHYNPDMESYSSP